MTDRLAWLEERRKGIGSSDVAKVLGMSRWGTALDVYLEKVNPPTNEPMKPALEWGTRKEPIIAAAIQDHYGWQLNKMPTRSHAEHPFLIASVDRYTSKDELVEIKTSSVPDGWGEVDTDQVPEHYWLQCQHQLEVVHSDDPSFNVCWMFVLIGHHDFRRYRIVRDPEFLHVVIDPLMEFWECVENRTPPEPDWGHPETIEAIKKLCHPQPGKVIDLSQEVVPAATKYERLGKLISELSKKREELKAKLIYSMGGAELGILPDGRQLALKEQQRAGYTVQPTSYLDFRLKKATKLKGAKNG